MLHRLNKHILDSTEQIHEMSNVMAKFDKYAICRNLSKYLINTLYHFIVMIITLIILILSYLRKFCKCKFRS